MLTATLHKMARAHQELERLRASLAAWESEARSLLNLPPGARLAIDDDLQLRITMAGGGIVPPDSRVFQFPINHLCLQTKPGVAFSSDSKISDFLITAVTINNPFTLATAEVD